MEVAERAVTKAVEEVTPRIVRQTLVSMGLDPEHPMEAQKDAQFVRSTRTRCEQAGSRGMIILIGLVLAGAVAVFWDGLKAALK